MERKKHYDNREEKVTDRRLVEVKGRKNWGEWNVICPIID